MVTNKKYKNAKVWITGRFYTDEKIIEVFSFRLLNKEEIKEIKLQKKSKTNDTCQTHLEKTSDKNW